MIAESRYGAEGVRNLDLFLDTAGIDLVAIDSEQSHMARCAFSRFGEGRHRAAINYGDCCAYALAMVARESFPFQGDDFGHTDVEPVDFKSSS